MSTDAFSDLTGLSTGPQPMRSKQTGLMKMKKSASNLLASVSAGSSGQQRAPRPSVQATVHHDLSELEQPSVQTTPAPATDTFELFDDLALPPGKESSALDKSKVKIDAIAPPLVDLPPSIPVLQPSFAPTPPVPSASPATSATVAAVPDYHDLISDASTSQRQRSGSGSSSWSPREASQAVFFQIDDDPQRFPGHAPAPLPLPARSRSSNSVPAAPPATAVPEPAHRAPRPSLLDTSDAGLGGSDLDSARTQWYTPMASAPAEPSLAAAAPQHDLLGGFSGGGSPAADLLTVDDFLTPAATPAGGAAAEAGPPADLDFLGMSQTAAAAPAAAPVAPSATGDLLGGMGGGVGSHSTAPPADDIDYDFFSGGNAAADAGAAAAPVAGLSDADWLMNMAEAPAAVAGGPAAARPRSRAGGAAALPQAEEAGDVMLARVIAEARAAMGTLPVDRAQRVHIAIAQAEEYVEEQLAAKKRVAGVTPDGLRYARRSASRTAAQVLEKTLEHHVREVAQEAEIAEGVEFRDEIKASIKDWAFRGGTRRGLRNLLVDLDRVLWEGAAWKGVNLAEVSTDAQLRKTLNKARLLLHTDRMSGQPQKVKLRAELILIEIDKALKGVA